MSSKAKLAITIIVIVVALGGVYWWLTSQQGALAPSTAPGGASTSQNGAAQPQLTSGNSNADLNQDLATIDAQMNGVSSDSASMNNSFNDQPVTQSQP